MSEEQKFRHILVIEDRKGRRILSLEEDVYTIGRDSNNAIVLYDYQVSRTHATIIRTVDDEDVQNFSYRIIDGNLEGKTSTNGIYINGRPSVSHQLKHGDSISFASEAKASYYIVSTESGIDLFNLEGLEKIAASRVTLDSESDDTVISKDSDSQSLEEQQELIRLASFPELSPNPIIELDWQGNLTYVNPAASLKFPTLYEDKLDHPILSNLLCEDSNRQGNLFLREVKIGTEVFEQYVHYLSEKKLIRSYIFDFTKRKIAEAQLRENQARYQAIIGQITQGIFLAYANNRRIIEANSAFLELLGYSAKDISNLTIYNIIANDLTNINSDLTLVAEQKEEKLVSKYLFRRQDGSLINLQASISLTTYQNKDIFCFVIHDVDTSYPKQDLVDYLAYHDQVTHLPNQTLFEEQLTILVSKAEKYRYLMGLIAIEIDNWQAFSHNQTPESNQELLKNIVQILQSCLQVGDLLARWDEDKFMILLPRIKGPKEAAKTSKKISTTLSQYLEKQSEDSEVKLLTHVSLLTYPIDGEDASLLIKNSLTSLEQGKAVTNLNYGVTGFNLTPKSASLLKLENLIGNAIKEQEFFLCYQPVIDINSQKLTGLEALLRWEHPELGKVTPRHFMRLTEETDFMLPLGIWILQTTMLQMQKWIGEEIAPLPIGVNISSRQLNQPNFISTITKLLEQTGLPPHLLELELTETCFVENPEIAYRILEQISALKVRLCLDSFGTGNVALIHLQKVPFNTVKISPDIISTIDQDTKAQALIQSMTTLCEGYGSRLVAVGVERLEQMELLRTLGCTEIQGNLFSRPLQSKEATVFLHQSDKNTLN
jgi:diguanylate cyclase (GGDEF)-like protein/PAS domain S-box-containing protein